MNCISYIISGALFALMFMLFIIELKITLFYWRKNGKYIKPKRKDCTKHFNTYCQDINNRK